MTQLETYNNLYTLLATVTGLNVYTDETRNRDIEYPFIQLYLDGEGDPANYTSFETEYTTLDIEIVIGEKVSKNISEDSKKTANQNLITRTVQLVKLLGIKDTTGSKYGSTMIDNDFVRISRTKGKV